MRERIEKSLRSMRDLPTLPVVYRRIGELLKSPRTGATDIAAVIRHDQALVTRVLRQANAAHYGFQERVVSVERAVSLMGLSAVRDLMLSVPVMELTTDGEAETFATRFWRHSMGVAAASRAMARRYDPDAVGEAIDEEEFFLAGLVHDVGKLLWIQSFPKQLQQVLELAGKQRWSMAEAENEVFGMTHTRAGKAMAKRWRLSEAVTEAIAWHHDPRLAENHPLLVSTVHIADCLAYALSVGDGGSGKVPWIRPEAWNLTGLGQDQVEDLLEDAWVGYQEGMMTLGFHDGSQHDQLRGELSRL